MIFLTSTNLSLLLAKIGRKKGTHNLFRSFTFFYMILILHFER
jgi:hypothetical protein